jgi:mevalonate kinase
MSSVSTYYTPGKLLISGEYAVLYGAKALAVPVRYGQTLKVVRKNDKKGIVNWKSFDCGQPWFTLEMDMQAGQLISVTDRSVSHTIVNLMRTVKLLNPDIFASSYNIETNTDFSREWGLGTSSTLIVNLARWAGLNPYELLYSYSKGSGYDLAVGMENTPIIYRRRKRDREIRKVNFYPSFSENLYFVYLNRKQATESSIDNLRHNVKNVNKYVMQIEHLTEKILEADHLDAFETYIIQHESVTSEFINRKCVKEKLFHDFLGEMKSLGAWGGDFILVTWQGKPEDLYAYFSSKGFHIIFRYDQLALKDEHYGS